MRLSGNRYNEIDKEVIKLFELLTINKFPLNCFKICEQLGFELIPYSQLPKKKRKALIKESEDGCHALWEIEKGRFAFIIYYNDDMPERRIRFTIMHEIGHIILNHTEHSDLAESEANYFAKYALAPPPLVHELHIEDYLELSERFDISHQCAFYAMNNYNKWLRYGSPEYRDYEVTLINLFQPVL